MFNVIFKQINMSGIAVWGDNGWQFTYLFTPNFCMHINGASLSGCRQPIRFIKIQIKTRNNTNKLGEAILDTKIAVCKTDILLIHSSV